MPNPYAPNETALQIFNEETWLQGALLSNIAYGVELTLFIICAYFLIRHTNRDNYKEKLPFLVFIIVIFILGTLFMVCGIAVFTQLAFIEDRNFPGGPNNYEKVMLFIPVDEVANVSYVIANWLMDLLLVWRCAVIYQTCGPFRWAMTLFPCLMFLGSFVMGVIFVVQTSSSSPWGAGATDSTLAYFSMTLALNIIVTVLIAARILLFRREVMHVMGKDHGSQYTTIVAILVESASLFSAFAILFLVPYALDYPIAQAFMQTLSQVQSISSLLIIFRVAQGKEWTRATAQEVMSRQHDLSDMRFVPGRDGVPRGVSTGGTMLDTVVVHPIPEKPLEECMSV